MKSSRSLARLLAAVALVAAAASPVTALEVGQKAPDFTLPAADGKQVKLSDLTAKGPVVIYTLIQAFTPTWTKEIADFDAALPQFEAAGAQVVGVSTDHAATLGAFVKQFGTKHLLLADFRRQMLPAYGALETNEQSPIFRYAKRAYFVVDRQGVIRYVKVQPNALDVLKADEVLKAFKESGAS